MVTRKDHKAIARTFKDSYEVSTEPVRFALRDMIDALAQYFASDNPRFSRQKFVNACGIQNKD